MSQDARDDTLDGGDNAGALLVYINWRGGGGGIPLRCLAAGGLVLGEAPQKRLAAASRLGTKVGALGDMVRGAGGAGGAG